MRFSLVLTLLLCMVAGSLPLELKAQDSLRRVEGSTVTVSGVSTPVDSLPISTSFRQITPTQMISSFSLDQAVRAVPGLQIDNRNNYALGDRITMRGIGARSFFGTRGIRVMKDDVPLTFADGQTNLEILDPTQLASVRVLRGPASSIFGNASGGTLLFRSLQPPAPAEVIRGAIAVGSWKYQRNTGSIGSASEDLAYGAYITIDSINGYRDWSGARTIHLGAKVMYAFGDDALRFTLDNVEFSAQNPGALSQRLLDSNRRMAYAPNVRQKTGKEGRQSQAGLTYISAFGENKLATSAYAISRSITNPTPQQIVSLDRNLVGGRITFESPRLIDVMGNNGLATEQAPPWHSMFDWSAVLDVQYQMDDRIEHANDTGNKGALQTDQEEKILNIGVGAHATLPLISTLNLTAGLRYDMLNFKAQDKLITEANPDESGNVSMSAFSPSVGLLYTGFADHHFFANASLNFETPTSTELANQPDGSGGYNAELEAQRTTSFEAGWRGSFDEDIRYNAAFFMALIQDALIPFQVEGQEGRDYYRNAGEITNKGVELEVIADLHSSLRATLGYTYVDSRFTDYITASDTLNDNEQPGVHPQLGTLDLLYHPPIGFYANATMKYAARVAVNDANTSYSPEYTVVDLRAGWLIDLKELEKYTIKIEPFVHIHNLFNRKYISSFAVNAFGGRYYEPAPERTIVAGIQVLM